MGRGGLAAVSDAGVGGVTRRVTAAQRAAQARADAKRPQPVPVRLNEDDLVWLDRQRETDEGRSTCIKRLAGFPSCTEGPARNRP